MGTFIDTLVVCTMTGLVLIVTGVWSSGLKGAELSASAFTLAFPGFGGQFLALALVVFAYTTILGWAYYGEKCWEYLVGASVEAKRERPMSNTNFANVGAVLSIDLGAICDNWRSLKARLGAAACAAVVKAGA